MTFQVYNTLSSGGVSMLSVRKDEGVMEYEGNFFAWTPLDKPCPYAYAEFIDGAWVAPREPCDTWEAKSISWEEFERRTSMR